MKRAGVILAALALFACAKKAPPPPATEGGGAALSSASTKKDDLSTTSWSIAGDNLDGQIAEWQRLNRVDSKSRATLVELLLMRGQYLARVADYEAADEVAGRAMRTDPNVDALLARAHVHSAFHRFSAAAKDIDTAEKSGADKARLASARGSLSLALGKYDDAAALFPPNPRSTTELTTAAVLAARMQKPVEAERLFEEARRAFVDVSPFPVAWMDFQRATVLEAAGNTERARGYYEEAVEKIPVYAHAVVHLALSAPPDRAIALVTPLLKTSDDPDVLAALADAHRRAKNEPEAKRFSEQARERYDELVKKHPEAFGDHAARFYLSLGDGKKALGLAADNAKLRPTEEAIDLWMGAATAAADRAAMCQSAAALDALRYVSPERKRLATATLATCSRDGG